MEPLITVQPDWPLSLADEAPIWINVRRSSSQHEGSHTYTYHARISALRQAWRSKSASCGDDPPPPTVVATPADPSKGDAAGAQLMTLSLPEPRLLHVHCGSTEAIFQAPEATLADLHLGKAVNSIAVTRGGIGVSCDSAGRLLVWDSATGEPRRSLEGHVGEVYASRFFPSGIVALTGGADCRVRVWACDTGACAAVFVGHTGGVTALEPVERGRNVVSAGRDGTARLWDVGQQRCLAVYGAEESGHLPPDPANCLCLVALAEAAAPSPESTDDDREVGTACKVALVGHESGRLLCHSLADRRQLWSVQLPAAVNFACCSATVPDVAGPVAAVGLADGRLLAMRLPGGATQQLPPGDGCQQLPLGPLLSGAFLRRPDRLVVGSQSGICALLGLAVPAASGAASSSSAAFDVSLLLQLTGPDCDPVYCLAWDAGHVYTGCRDGRVRKYRC